MTRNVGDVKMLTSLMCLLMRLLCHVHGSDQESLTHACTHTRESTHTYMSWMNILQFDVIYFHL